MAAPYGGANQPIGYQRLAKAGTAGAVHPLESMSRALEERRRDIEGSRREMWCKGDLN